MSIAVVNFRTLASGSYRHLNGKRRGYWRVLVLRDLSGPTCVHSRNVLRVAYEGPDGIEGVTARSAYCLDSSLIEATRIAAHLNMQRISRILIAHHTPEGL